MVNKPINLERLGQELAAAGVAVPALGLTGQDLHTYDTAGARAELPASAVPVVTAHDATQLTPAQAQVAQDTSQLQQLADAYQQALTDISAGRAQLAAGQTNLADAAWTPLTPAAKTERLRAVLQGTLAELDAVEQRQRQVLLALRVVVRRTGAG